MRTRLTVLTVIAAFLLALVPAAGSASASPPAPAVPRLVWGACAPGSGGAQAGGFQCATAEVPLDYSHPRSRNITLALVRRPATGPGTRLGTLFLNPGGPGGTGTTQMVGWIGLLPDGLQQRFDVVSWDPRGIGESTAVQCFDSSDAEAAFLGPYANFPVTAAQQRGYTQRWKAFGQRCAARNGDLLEHVSTADTARDLDLLRQAVGDAKLTYLGLSYGTYLGATYANLFPDKVRALVLDGNVAPSNWTNRNRPVATRNLSNRIGSNASVSETLDDFLRLCGATDTQHCAFSAGSPRATAVKFDRLLDRLEKGPIALPGGGSIGYAELLGQISNGLDIVTPFASPVTGASSKGWTGIAVAFEAIWQARDTPVVSSSRVASAGVPDSYQGPEQGLSVVCGETPGPASSRYPILARSELRRNGPIGLSSLWFDEPCSTWPAHASQPYAGPWNKNTSAPILVIGNTTDPSTPYSNSTLMVRELANARLLTVQGYGHTVFLNPSACASAAQVAYFVNRRLPAKGTVCPQDTAPFAARAQSSR